MKRSQLLKALQKLIKQQANKTNSSNNNSGETIGQGGSVSAWLATDTWFTLSCGPLYLKKDIRLILANNLPQQETFTCRLCKKLLIVLVSCNQDLLREDTNFTWFHQVLGW